MKKVILLIVAGMLFLVAGLGVWWGASARAGSTRIGETLEQCTARYGDPVMERVNSAGFEKNGIRILVDFREDGRAASILYMQAGGFSEQEVERLLKLNGGGQRWIPEPVPFSITAMWISADNKMVAAYDPDDESFSVLDKNWLMYHKTGADADALSGF